MTKREKKQWVDGAEIWSLRDERGSRSAEYTVATSRPFFPSGTRSLRRKPPFFVSMTGPRGSQLHLMNIVFYSGKGFNYYGEYIRMNYSVLSVVFSESRCSKLRAQDRRSLIIAVCGMRYFIERCKIACFVDGFRRKEIGVSSSLSD